MDTWVALAGAGAAAVLAMVARWATRGIGGAEEAHRFVLRATVVSPDGTPVRLGTSVESGAVPSSTPTLISERLALEDDGEKIVIVPEGTTLLVRDFDGARRVALEAVTTHAGTAQRFSFDVGPKLRFWVLDAPGWYECRATDDPRRRMLPPRPEGYEITTRPPPPPAVDAEGHIAVTMGDLTVPLWMYGLEHPDEWLLGAREPGEPVVVIAAFNDAYAGEPRSDRCATSGCAAFLLQDAVWLGTSARATVGVPIAMQHARVFTNEGLYDWDDLASWRARFPEGTVCAWGAAREAVESDGYDVRARAGADAGETDLSGSLGTAGAKLIAALRDRGVASPIDAPFPALPRELEGAYLRVCDPLLVLILSHPNNQALPTQTPEVQRRIVDLARALFDAAPEAPVACLTWMVSVIYAHDCGGLGAEQREEALRFARAPGATRTGEIVRQLAPAILFRLGEAGESAAACRAALAEHDAAGPRTGAAATARRKWLTEVLAKAVAISR